MAEQLLTIMRQPKNTTDDAHPWVSRFGWNDLPHCVCCGAAVKLVAITVDADGEERTYGIDCYAKQPSASAHHKAIREAKNAWRRKDARQLRTFRFQLSTIDERGNTPGGLLLHAHNLKDHQQVVANILTRWEQIRRMWRTQEADGDLSAAQLQELENTLDARLEEIRPHLGWTAEELAARTGRE